jgi:AcrR family transcriptional regulator
MASPLVPSSPADTPTDGRRARGDRTRAAVLREALQLASVDGLEGLTIAHVADRLGVHKSSVHTAFGSKADLQVAVLRRTREILVEHVIAPSLRAAPGRPRLDAVGEAWFTYLAAGIFEGGCVLSSASTELDGRPGPARDELVAVMTEWLDVLAANARAAIKAGDFDPVADPDQVAFELNAIGMTANWHHQLFGGDPAFRFARVAWADTLDRHRPHV